MDLKPLSLSTIISAPLFYIAYFALLDQKPAPDTTIFVKNEYDYIVVGGGSAGSAVASRLSEIPCVSVLLLEAGGSPTFLDNIPFIGRFRWFTDVDWAYKTVPQRHTGKGLRDKKVVWPSGKGLGGSSIINAMLYIRGAHQNFDDWEKLGAKGWGWKDVLPYFLKLEDYRDEEFKNNGFHATGGPITIEKPRHHWKTKDSILEAAMNLGLKMTDSNGPRMTGFYDLRATIRDAERCMTSKAYLVPAEKRPNLDIVNHAQVTKIIMDGKKAVGVEYGRLLGNKRITARKEVILSAGTTNTAQLLMLSGIGPKKDLEKLGIKVVADLPVGEYMQDHCSVPMIYELSKDKEIPNVAAEVAKYALNRSGIFASAEAIDYLAFINTHTNSTDIDLPNVELYFAYFNTLVAKLQFGMTDKVFNQVLLPYQLENTYLCFSSVVQPKSNGTLKLDPANPYGPPLIDPNYFSDPEDLKAMVEGMKMCTKIVASEAMKKFGARELTTLYPGCEDKEGDQDKYYTCVAQSVVVTMSHQIGTAKMGDINDPTAVVDTELKVKGIEGLRVVDASVMPKVTSGNTNIPSIMIGEKGSDIIKKSITCNG